MPDPTPEPQAPASATVDLSLTIDDRTYRLSQIGDGWLIPSENIPAGEGVRRCVTNGRARSRKIRTAGGQTGETVQVEYVGLEFLHDAAPASPESGSTSSAGRTTMVRSRVTCNERLVYWKECVLGPNATKMRDDLLAHIDALTAQLAAREATIERLTAEKKQLKKERDGWESAAHDFSDRFDETRRKYHTLLDVTQGTYWNWQGDGEDHPESLTCPVVMSADKLREFVAQAATIKRQEEELERLRAANKHNRDGFEEHERKWYLEQNKTEDLASQLATVQAERERIYDECCEQIKKVAAAEAERDRLVEALQAFIEFFETTRSDVPTDQWLAALMAKARAALEDLEPTALAARPQATDKET